MACMCCPYTKFITCLFHANVIKSALQCFNPIQTGLYWSICDGGGLLGPPPPLCISGTNNARVMKFTHNDHLRTKKPHTQF